MLFSRLTSLLAFVLPLGVYFFTAAPTTYWEDTAAFQTAAFELGIVHNPSFPLYVLIGKVATLIPGADPRWLVNLVSALFGALSIWVLYKIAVILLTSQLTRAGQLLPRVIALVAALSTATIYGFWLQALRAEVYSLNCFLILATIWLILNYRFREIDLTRFLMMFGFLAGTGLANHSLIFLAALVPLALMVAIAYSDKLFNVTSISIAGAFSFLALTVFLYLPLRELFAPTFNWGDFSSFDAFLDSVLRLNTHTAVELLGATTPFVDRILSVIGSLLTPLGIVACLLALAGVIFYWRYDSFIASMLTALVFFNLFVTGYAAEFSKYNLDLYGYLMPTYALITLLALVGLSSLTAWLGRRFALKPVSHKAALSATAALVMVVALFNFDATYAKASKKYVCVAEDYATNIIASLPYGAIFLAGEDNSFAPLLCQQVVIGARQDVIVLSGGALLRHDYRRKVQERFPQLNYPDNWNESEFELEFRKNLYSWIKSNDKSHPVYLTLSEWTSPLIKELAPEGVVYSYSPGYQLTTEDTRRATAKLHFYSDLAVEYNDLTSREHFGRLLYNFGVYLVGQEQFSDAVALCRDAARTDPENVDLLLNCLRMFTAAGSVEDQRWVSDMIFAVDPENEQVMQILQKSLAMRQEANR